MHIPLRSTAKVCKKLGIDFAEACTGFEFGNKIAVPVLTGVVVAEENEHMVIDAWEEEEAIRQRKEDEKRLRLVLGVWKKMFLGLRVLDRMKREYQPAENEDLPDEFNPFTNRKKLSAASSRTKGKASVETNGEEHASASGFVDEDTMAGGFFPPGHDEEEIIRPQPNAPQEEEMGGGFLPDDDEQPNEGGGFVVEDDSELNGPKSLRVTFTGNSHEPISLLSSHRNNDMDDSKADASDDDVPRHPGTKTPTRRSNKNSTTSPFFSDAEEPGKKKTNKGKRQTSARNKGTPKSKKTSPRNVTQKNHQKPVRRSARASKPLLSIDDNTSSQELSDAVTGTSVQSDEESDFEAAPIAVKKRR